MKAIMVMFDSLNRHMLEPYGCDWVKTPNFRRLAEKSVTFDKSFVGSMPCMPARRELHTGRYNFLHRSWGPLEPFDDSMPQILKENGIHSHLASDHYHYWEDGGSTYHNRYSTWEISRGQEGDPGIADLTDNVPEPKVLDTRRPLEWRRKDWVNRYYMQEEKDFPQAKTFAMGERFLHTNHNEDNWFLHIETFDPHEPYYSPQKYKDLYPHEWNGPHFDWPNYGNVTESPEEVKHMRYENAALISMCDNYLGRILDLMDKYDLWKDTMLIVNTDHGFLLGEHDHWGKCFMPFYNEIARTPLWIWDPRSSIQNERRSSLVQTIDIAPTILEYFGIDRTKDMFGSPLRQVVENDTPVREGGLFGIHGGHVNVTDGQYVYMRAPEGGVPNEPLFNYTHMPTHAQYRFPAEELQNIELSEPFEFTKGCRTMKIKANTNLMEHTLKTRLFDIDKDPEQKTLLKDKNVEKKMTNLLIKLMKENDAPEEQYERLGLG